MREVGERYAKRNAPLQQFVDPRLLAARQALGVRAGAQAVGKTGNKKHQFGSFVARVIGAVSEMHARGFQRARNSADGGANGLEGRTGERSGSAGRLMGGADGFGGCVG